MKKTSLLKKIFLITSFLLPGLLQAQRDTLYLDDLYLLALENNFGILISKNNATLANNNNTLGNAGMLPSLNLVGSGNIAVNNTRLQFFSGDTREADNAKNKSINGLAELTWTVFDGLRMFATKEKLEELQRMGELEIRLQAELLYLQLSSQYFRLMQEQKLQQVLGVSLSISKTRLGLAQRKFDIGSGSELDLNQARIDLSADSALMIRQVASIENLITDINFLVGRSPEIRFAASLGMELQKDLFYEELRENMERQNSNLLLARAENNVAYQQMQETGSYLMPNIDIFTNYTAAQSKAEVGILQSNKSYGLGYGFRLSYNLFDGFNRRRELQNSRILLNNSEIFTRSVLLESDAELYKSYTSWNNSMIEVELENQNVLNTRKNMEIAVEMYRMGALNEIDFREIQFRALEAENRLLTAEYLAKIAEINMLFISGNLPARFLPTP